jgi:hypothetical protein
VLHALGIDPMQAQQRGYLLMELPDAPDTARHIAQTPR